MVLIRAMRCQMILVALLFAPQLVFAAPAEPAKEESADEIFAKSFLGKTYDDELEVEGWIDLGGGLVAPPIYVHQYQREEDGTYLVLTSREVAKAAADVPASFVVTDALVVPAPQKEAAVSIACVQGEDATLKFMGEAKGNEEKEWWSDVRHAWEISLETGEIVSIPTKGVRCTNPNW